MRPGLTAPKKDERHTILYFICSHNVPLQNKHQCLSALVIIRHEHMSHYVHQENGYTDNQIIYLEQRDKLKWKRGESLKITCTPESRMLVTQFQNLHFGHIFQAPFSLPLGFLYIRRITILPIRLRNSIDMISSCIFAGIVVNHEGRKKDCEDLREGNKKASEG